MKPNSFILGSPCCRMNLINIAEIVMIVPGGEQYYRHKCSRCNALCWPMVLRQFDSAGHEIKPGDIIEVPELSPEKLGWEHAEHYHAVYRSEYNGGLEIRDLGNNNIGMYSLYDKYYTIGPYWKHLDKVTDEDLEYYWHTTREEAEKILKKDRVK